MHIAQTLYGNYTPATQFGARNQNIKRHSSKKAMLWLGSILVGQNRFCEKQQRQVNPYDHAATALRRAGISFKKKPHFDNKRWQLTGFFKHENGIKTPVSPHEAANVLQGKGFNFKG